MVISTANKEFIDSLIDYYVSESSSYKQIAEQYVPEIESIPDAAFGVIVGCVYSSFLEMCKNQDIQIGLEEMTEFNKMLKSRAASIKKSIVDPTSITSFTETEAKAETDTTRDIDKYNQTTENGKPTVESKQYDVSDTKHNQKEKQDIKEEQVTQSSTSSSSSSSSSSSPPPQDNPIRTSEN